MWPILWLSMKSNIRKSNCIRWHWSWNICHQNYFVRTKILLFSFWILILVTDHWTNFCIFHSIFVPLAQWEICLIWPTDWTISINVNGPELGLDEELERLGKVGISDGRYIYFSVERKANIWWLEVQIQFTQVQINKWKRVWIKWKQMQFLCENTAEVLRF